MLPIKEIKLLMPSASAAVKRFRFAWRSNQEAVRAAASPAAKRNAWREMAVQFTEKVSEGWTELRFRPATFGNCTSYDVSRAAHTHCGYGVYADATRFQGTASRYLLSIR